MKIIDYGDHCEIFHLDRAPISVAASADEVVRLLEWLYPGVRPVVIPGPR